MTATASLHPKELCSIKPCSKGVRRSPTTAGVEASHRPIFMMTHTATEGVDIRRQGLPPAAVAPPPHGRFDAEAPAGRRPAPHLVPLEDIQQSTLAKEGE